MLILLAFILVYAQAGYAVDAAAPALPQKSFGHNLAPSNETLSKGQWTAGSYYLGTGITDDLTVGLSPWILFGYNLDNLIIKYKHKFQSDEYMSHQLAFFTTNNQLGNRYKQTSLSYWLTYGPSFENYKCLFTLNYMYFWNETRPFSLRREPFNNQAQQITITSLHQFQFSPRTILQFELGILGINYSFPNLSAGASWLHYFASNWSTQIGASFSKRIGYPRSPDPNDTYIKAEENYYSDSIHPEIQFQYWF